MYLTLQNNIHLNNFKGNNQLKVVDDNAFKQTDTQGPQTKMLKKYKHLYLWGLR